MHNTHAPSLSENSQPYACFESYATIREDTPISYILLETVMVKRACRNVDFFKNVFMIIWRHNLSNQVSYLQCTKHYTVLTRLQDGEINCIDSSFDLSELTKQCNVISWHHSNQIIFTLVHLKVNWNCE